VDSKLDIPVSEAVKVLGKMKTGRKPNVEKELEVKTRDLRCRVTDTEYEEIETYFGGKKSKFLHQAVKEKIHRLASLRVSTTFTPTQHRLYDMLNSRKIDDFTLGLLVDVLEEQDRQRLLAKLELKLQWTKTAYKV